MIINQKLFHGVSPNRSQESRVLFAVSYRPAWASPIADIPEHDPEKVAKLPAQVRPLFKSPNSRNVDFNVKNWSEDMPADAPKLGSSRWDVWP